MCAIEKATSLVLPQRFVLFIFKVSVCLAIL